jgi:DNA-binding NarL/FixJ family response regulator
MPRGRFWYTFGYISRPIATCVTAGSAAVSIKVVLADAQPVFLAGMKHVLDTDGHFEVAAACTTGAEALAAVLEQRPDVLVTDLHLKGIDGLSVLGQLQQRNVTTRTVILATSLSADEALRVLRLGVAGVVLKDMAPDMLKRCIRKVHSGGKWMETQSIGRALEKILQRETAEDTTAKLISPAELRVVRMVAEGLRNKEIASALSITEGTVKVHLHTIYQKLKVKGRGGLTAYARRAGLL